MFNDQNEKQRKQWLGELSGDADQTIEARRKRAIEALGTRWIAHPANAPRKGVYHPTTGARLA
jgi:hypothetical protein